MAVERTVVVEDCNGKEGEGVSTELEVEDESDAVKSDVGGFDNEVPIDVMGGDIGPDGRAAVDERLVVVDPMVSDNGWASTRK